MFFCFFFSGSPRMAMFLLSEKCYRTSHFSPRGSRHAPRTTNFSPCLRATPPPRTLPVIYQRASQLSFHCACAQNSIGGGTLEKGGGKFPSPCCESHLWLRSECNSLGKYSRFHVGENLWLIARLHASDTPLEAAYVFGTLVSARGLCEGK